MNADDPLLFGPNIGDEYELCRDQLGLDDATLAQIAVWSSEASAAPQESVQRHRRAAEEWLVDSR